MDSNAITGLMLLAAAGAAFYLMHNVRRARRLDTMWRLRKRELMRQNFQ